MSMIQALGNVSKVRGALIFVEDAEAELAFYRDVIGLRLLYRTQTFIRFDATQGTSLSLISGGSRLGRAQGLPPGRRRPGADRRQPGSGDRPPRRGRRPARGRRPDGLRLVLLPLGSGGQSAPVLRVGVHPTEVDPERLPG